VGNHQTDEVVDSFVGRARYPADERGGGGETVLDARGYQLVGLGEMQDDVAHVPAGAIRDGPVPVGTVQLQQQAVEFVMLVGQRPHDRVHRLFLDPLGHSRVRAVLLCHRQSRQPH
jgi:hypothetical protein